jgi:exopolyphosphatase/guanosine-5'-triphosphate,3'-diphosphate pyrophosphatase
MKNEVVAEALVLRGRYDEEPSHSDQVAALALQLFDGLQTWHGLGACDRDLLHAAALVHDIGWSQTADGKGHHKESARLIRDSTWQSLDKIEVELVAQVARYHRKAPPQPDHEEFQQLKPGLRQRVMVLGGILRIADALDRTHIGVVQKVSVVITKPTLTLCVRAKGDWNAERAMVEIKSDMLQTASRREVVVEAISSD